MENLYGGITGQGTEIMSDGSEDFSSKMEFAKGLQKMVNTCKQTITQEPHMPFLSIYSLALEQDLEYALSSLHAATTLRMETFLQQEAENNLRKAKQTYMQRSEDSEKAKHVAAKAEEEQLGSSGGIGGPGTTTTKALDKKRRLEEEARNKASGRRGQEGKMHP
ncbi:hypothetical protein JD844_033980 [Phrynosoma platyrhinos]|uniref:Uncharacterized protein n=1 Tax=Phrynosoma platyrhinos TaxID=52577 RepID=A0ABQ7T8J1_PHRPL|nr:hypothetical protein JD844_033980 [Phrynosoma platyrhinos]